MAHIIFSQETRPARMALLHRLVAAARTMRNRIRKEQRLRATIFTLHRLNDHTLRDIGLERDNIEPMVRARCPGR